MAFPSRFSNPALAGLPRRAVDTGLAQPSQPVAQPGQQPQPELYGAPRVTPSMPVATLDRDEVWGDLQRSTDKARVEGELRGLQEPGEAPIYEPDAIDIIGAGLSGFVGNFGPSQRETRWNQQLDRDAAERREGRQALRDEVQFGNWLAGQDLRERSLQAREESLGLARDKQKSIDRRDDYRMDPNDPSVAPMREFVLSQTRGRFTPDEVANLSNDQLRAVMTMLNREAERAHAPEDTRIAANRAGATAGAATSARERASLPYDIAAEQRGEGRAERSAERSVETEGAQKIAEAERKRATERVALETLLGKLKGRKGGEALPAQGSFIERGAIKARASVLGGTGMGQEDSILDNDLTALGLQSYINKAGNAPNSEREQEVAGRMYRGDGTVGGAIRAIEERLGSMDAEVGQMRRTAPRSRVKAVPAAGDDEWEDL